MESIGMKKIREEKSRPSPTGNKGKRKRSLCPSLTLLSGAVKRHSLSGE